MRALRFSRALAASVTFKCAKGASKALPEKIIFCNKKLSRALSRPVFKGDLERVDLERKYFLKTL